MLETMSAELSQDDRVRVLEARVRELDDKLAALGIYARAILQVLQEKALVTSEEFAKRIQEIDLLDGKLDGR